MSRDDEPPAYIEFRAVTKTFPDGTTAVADFDAVLHFGPCIPTCHKRSSRLRRCRCGAMPLGVVIGCYQDGLLRAPETKRRMPGEKPFSPGIRVFINKIFGRDR